MGFYHLAEAHLRYGHVAIAVDLIRQASLSEGRMDRPLLMTISTARELGIAADSASEQLVDRLAGNVYRPVPEMAVMAVHDGRPDVAAAAVEWLEAGADSFTAAGRIELGRSLRGRSLTLRGRIAAAHDRHRSGHLLPA
jgi:hypothetical protein